MSKDKKNVSKLISFWLRHNPADANLKVNEFGWVKLANVVLALNQKGETFTADEIYELSLTFDKVRWEFSPNKDQIRATHGHSISVILDDKFQIPPSILYHGTATKNIESIIGNGILNMQRQFVHLSENQSLATEISKRHGKPIIIDVDAEEISNQGQYFYKTSDNVWLTSKIKPTFLSIGPWHTVNEEEKTNLLKELKKEIDNKHQLFDKSNQIELLMRRYDMDDCLFIDKSDNSVYTVHLTWSPEKENNPIYPNTKFFISLIDWINTELINDYNDWHNL